MAASTGPLIRQPRPALLLLVTAVAAALCFGAFASLLQPRGAVFDRGDPVGYYVYLRSLVHDGDLDFTNDYGLFQPSDEIPGPNLGRINSETGRPDNNYTIGLPLLVAPVYVAGNVVLGRHYAQTRSPGFPLFLDQLVFAYGGLLLLAAGIWLSFRFVCLYFRPWDSAVATLAFWLCSPLLYYSTREPFQSHSASIFAVGLFLYVWKAPALRPRARWVWMGTSAAFVVMARQQDAVILLLPLGTTFVELGWRNALPRLRPAFPYFGLGFVAMFALQMLVWHVLRGSVLTYAYRGQHFTYLAQPRIAEVLVSSNHGLISWHPIIAVCLIGLVLLSSSDRPAIGRLSLVVFVAQLYATASWWCWWMGNSFGHRAFLGLTPLFILGLAAVLARLERPWARRAFLVGTACLFLWNVVLMLAYLSEMIPYQGEFSWLQLLRELPRLPAEVVAKFRSL